jgi:hypothetical protein
LGHRPHVFRQVREDRTAVIAVGRGDKSSASLGLQGIFAHQPADLLGVDCQPLMAELGGDPTVAVGLELVTDRRDPGDDPRVVGLL